MRWVVAFALAAAFALPSTAGAAELTLVGSWGGPGSGPGQFNLVTDVLVAPDLSVYTLENGNDRVQRFTPAGERTGGWGSTGTNPGQFQQPESFTVSPAGDISVADTFTSTIQRFDANGTLQLTWGTNGGNPGQIRNPEGIVAVGASTIYVGDRGNNQIDRYDVLTNATFVNSWGSAGSGPGQFARLLELAADPAGNVYAVDRDNGRIQEFAPDGTFIRSFGTDGTGAGQLSNPIDVAIDPQGNVWVADNANFKLAKYAPDGTPIADYDRAGGQSIRPDAVAVAPNGDVYMADIQGNNPQVRRLSDAPPPKLGVSVVVSLVKGKVLVKVPGSRKFVQLTSADNIPVGAVIDATKGTVRLTSAADSAGTTQTSEFYSGVFKVAQNAAAKGVTDLILTGGSFKRCRGAGRASASPTVRKLWGSGSGKFRTKGRFSAASIRGTTWLTADRCDGTLTTVTVGSVTVRDLVRKRNIVLKAPKSYLARAR